MLVRISCSSSREKNVDIHITHTCCDVESSVEKARVELGYNVGGDRIGSIIGLLLNTRHVGYDTFVELSNNLVLE